MGAERALGRALVGLFAGVVFFSGAAWIASGFLVERRLHCEPAPPRQPACELVEDWGVRVTHEPLPGLRSVRSEFHTGPSRRGHRASHHRGLSLVFEDGSSRRVGGGGEAANLSRVIRDDLHAGSSEPRTWTLQRRAPAGALVGAVVMLVALGVISLSLFFLRRALRR